VKTTPGDEGSQSSGRYYTLPQHSTVILQRTKKGKAISGNEKHLLPVSSSSLANKHDTHTHTQTYVPQQQSRFSMCLELRPRMMCYCEAKKLKTPSRSLPDAFPDSPLILCYGGAMAWLRQLASGLLARTHTYVMHGSNKLRLVGFSELLAQRAAVRGLWPESCSLRYVVGLCGGQAIAAPPLKIRVLNLASCTPWGGGGRALAGRGSGELAQLADRPPDMPEVPHRSPAPTIQAVPHSTSEPEFVTHDTRTTTKLLHR